MHSRHACRQGAHACTHIEFQPGGQAVEQFSKCGDLFASGGTAPKAVVVTGYSVLPLIRHSRQHFQRFDLRQGQIPNIPRSVRCSVHCSVVQYHAFLVGCHAYVELDLRGKRGTSLFHPGRLQEVLLSRSRRRACAHAPSRSPTQLHVASRTPCSQGGCRMHHDGRRR